MALFSSDEEALEFTRKHEKHDLDTAQVRILEQMGLFREAGEVHLAAGRTLEAIQSFFKNQNDPGCARRAIDATLLGLWSHLSFGVSPETATTSDKELKQLFAFSARLNARFMMSHDLNEVRSYLFSTVNKASCIHPFKD